MNQLSKLNNLLIFIGAVVLAFVMGTCSSPNDEYERQMKEWKVKAEQAVQFGDSVKAENERIAKENLKRDSITTAQSKEIKRLRAQADQQRKKNDATLDSLKKHLPDTCKSALDLAENYRKEADDLRVALDSADTRDSIKTVQIADLKKVNVGLVLSVDSLTKIINIVPEKKKETFLGIPKPSRTVTFIAGAILGGTAAIYVERIARH